MKVSKSTIPYIPVYSSEWYKNKETKKQACGFCPEDKCLLDCAICVSKIKK